MAATKKTTKTEAAPEPEASEASEPATPDTAEAPGAAGERFRAAVLAVHDGASGERIEQLLTGA